MSEPLTEFEKQVYVALGDSVDWDLARRVAAAIRTAVKVAQERTSTPIEPSCLNDPEDAEDAGLQVLRGDA